MLECIGAYGDLTGFDGSILQAGIIAFINFLYGRQQMLSRRMLYVVCAFSFCINEFSQ